MGPMSIKEKCGKLKEKLIEFKEKAANGVQFLENIVEDLKNGSLIEADKLVAISKIYKEDADKRYKKIKWLVGYIKDLAKNKFIKDLFGIIGGKLEEFFTATETQWGRQTGVSELHPLLRGFVFDRNRIFERTQGIELVV